MSPIWNLPFAVLLVLALLCRLRPEGGLAAGLEPALRFFGVGGPAGRAAADFLGITAVAGLLFVAWSDRIPLTGDLWLAVDLALTALGLGLAGAWILGRADEQPAPAAPPERLTMMDVDELPHRGDSGPHGPAAPVG